MLASLKSLKPHPLRAGAQVSCLSILRNRLGAGPYMMAAEHGGPQPTCVGKRPLESARSWEVGLWLGAGPLLIEIFSRAIIWDPPPTRRPRYCRVKAIIVLEGIDPAVGPITQLIMLSVLGFGDFSPDEAIPQNRLLCSWRESGRRVRVHLIRGRP